MLNFSCAIDNLSLVQTNSHFDLFDYKSEKMFSFLKSKSPVEKLTKQYQSLMAEAHKLSTSNRTASDAKVKEANEIQDKIESLLKNSK
ncbi:MAG: Lacal_2735 family protein [Bacteroidota bacterium]